jgi:hypothetical protein
MLSCSDAKTGSRWYVLGILARLGDVNNIRTQDQQKHPSIDGGAWSRYGIYCSYHAPMCQKLAMDITSHSALYLPTGNLGSMRQMYATTEAH